MVDENVISEAVRGRIQAMHEARELGLTKCRSLIQLSAKSIRHIHRGQFDEASRLLSEANNVAVIARNALQPFGELYFAGYLNDAEKELVEAHVVLALVQNTSLPDAETLGVGIMAYLNGLGEAASECRRFAVDEMRKQNFDNAERILEQMESIYDELITVDYPDAMTNGLRRTCDALRPVIERTRNDLFASLQQNDVVRELKATRDALQGSATHNR